MISSGSQGKGCREGSNARSLLLDFEREIKELGAQIESGIDMLDGDRVVDEGAIVAFNPRGWEGAERRGVRRESQ